jgi:hypothetical protein
MDPLSVLFALGSALGIVLAVLNIREKLRSTPPTVHPLEDPLRDIALAIRDWKA